jgi:hypothetical protein
MRLDALKARLNPLSFVFAIAGGASDLPSTAINSLRYVVECTLAGAQILAPESPV